MALAKGLHEFTISLRENSRLKQWARHQELRIYGRELG